MIVETWVVLPAEKAVQSPQYISFVIMKFNSDIPNYYTLLLQFGHFAVRISLKPHIIWSHWEQAPIYIYRTRRLRSEEENDLTFLPDRPKVG
jgi:hypothetical protein